MDKEIQKSAEELIDVIRNSAQYRNYCSCMETLEEYPGLLDRIMELRKKTIEVYHASTSEDLLENSEELGREFKDLEKYPEVNAFLEAEEEMIHILKDLTSRIATSVDIRIPGLFAG